jgi:hypothetical protein
MSKSFFMVSINWIATPQTAENIKALDDVFGRVGDWLRFSGTCWVVVTDKTSQDIFTELSKFLKKDDCEIIAKIDPSTVNGWAPKWIDNWITSRRSNL